MSPKKKEGGWGQASSWLQLPSNSIRTKKLVTIGNGRPKARPENVYSGVYTGIYYVEVCAYPISLVMFPISSLSRSQSSRLLKAATDLDGCPGTTLPTAPAATPLAAMCPPPPFPEGADERTERVGGWCTPDKVNKTASTAAVASHERDRGRGRREEEANKRAFPREVDDRIGNTSSSSSSSSKGVDYVEVVLGTWNPFEYIRNETRIEDRRYHTGQRVQKNENAGFRASQVVFFSDDAAATFCVAHRRGWRLCDRAKRVRCANRETQSRPGVSVCVCV